MNNPFAQLRTLFALLLPRVGSRRLQAVERLPLAPGHMAVILRKDGVEHFILLSPHGAQSLSQEPCA